MYDLKEFFVLFYKNFTILGPEAETSDLQIYSLYKLHYHTNMTTQHQKQAKNQKDNGQLSLPNIRALTDLND